MDVVGEGDQSLDIAVVILEGDFGDGVVLGAAEVNDLLMDGGLILVDVTDELPDAALVAHGFALLFAFPLILDADAQARVQESLLPHTGMENLIVIDRVVKHLRVGLEADGGAGFIRLAHHMDSLGDLAPGEGHLVDFSFLVDLNLQPFGQSIDHRGAHAVEAAGDLIAPAAELAAGVQNGENNFQSTLAGLLLNVYGDAAAVIGDGDDIPLLNANLNVVTEPGQGLIDGVIHNFINQVVQTRGGGGADVHARPLAHRLQALQDLDL